MTPLTEALHAAFEAVRPELPALLHRLETPTVTALDDEATEQFLHAFASLMHEGIDGGHEQRDFVMVTAVPALVASGQSGEEIVRTTVAFFVALTARMLGELPAERRDEASLWLARYAAEYILELMAAASAASGDGPA